MEGGGGLPPQYRAQGKKGSGWGGWYGWGGGVPADEIHTGLPTLKELEQQRYRVVVDVDLRTPSLAAHLHGLLGLPRDEQAGKGGYMPFRFVSTERVSTVDRMLLAFDAFVFSQVSGAAPATGEIIHGQEYATTKVPLATLYTRVRSVVQNISQQLADPAPPALVLNKHCVECQFASRCARIAKEMDDLSLLAKMSEKERQRFRERGIFTVTQLSHTFRYRKRAGKKHDHALKALAIRKDQIHTIGPVTWTPHGTPVYIDVEGDSDRDFYYCIGIRFESAGVDVQRSFWADDPTEEGRMWTECLAALGEIENARLVHYGSFETSFLRRMKKRYPTAASPDLLRRLLESSSNR